MNRAWQPDSQTATFAALKLYVDNWRWNGVPFYLRSGKAMSCRTTQIVIQFRCPPHMMFDEKGVGPWTPIDWSFRCNRPKEFSCTSRPRCPMPE